MAEDDDIETYTFSGSSNVAEATFKKSTGETTVIFRRDGREYDGRLSQSQWDQWKAAPSAGKFYHENLKGLFS